MRDQCGFHKVGSDIYFGLKKEPVKSDRLFFT